MFNFIMWSVGIFVSGLLTGYVFTKAKYEPFKK